MREYTFALVSYYSILTWQFIFMLLSKSPQVVENIRQEHDQVLGTNFQDGIEDLVNAPQRLQDLPYTDSVIKEAMRLFPVGFGVPEAAQDAALTHNGQVLPIGNGLVIALNGHDLHYNPKYFSNPTEFQPERWLGSEEIPRPHFRTFSRGLRACLGQNLAMNEMKVIMIMTMRDYDFECQGLRPNQPARATYTDMDGVFGDSVFQELGMEARLRCGMMLKVKKRV